MIELHKLQILHDSRSLAGGTCLERVRVDGGWLYVAHSWSLEDGGTRSRSVAVSTTFVADSALTLTTQNDPLSTPTKGIADGP